MKKTISFIFVKKLTAVVSLLAMAVICAAGMISGARIVTMTYRSAIAIVVIGVISRIIVKVLTSYEEMNSGKG